ncbi:MAG: hypothetical protein AAF663_06375 [Planctomycetota bacterium]
MSEVTTELALKQCQQTIVELGQKLEQKDADLAALRKRVGELEERRRYDRKRVSELCQRIDELQGYHPDRNDDAPPETVSPSPTYAELEAIVAKLPLTADNVRVVPGMEVWPVNSEGLATGMTVHTVVWSDEDEDFWDVCGDFSRYYSTESAARQALEGGKK